METNFETIGKSRGAIARERVRADLEILSRDAENLLKATAGDISGQVKEARMRVAAALERAKTTCEQLQDESLATAKAAAARADIVVREHPYESIGAAFGLGVLIGLVMARK